MTSTTLHYEYQVIYDDTDGVTSTSFVDWDDHYLLWKALFSERSVMYSGSEVASGRQAVDNVTYWK